MDDFAAVDADTLLSGRGDWLDAGRARRLAAHPLASLDTEYPHYVREVEGPEGPPVPSEQHPVFYGSYDWHSAVHGHWCLVRLCRCVADHPDEADIRASIDERLTDAGVAREVEYLDANPSFEKPYGWGWLLRLAAELRLWDDPQAADWRETLRPLEERVVEGVEDALLGQSRPFRVGTHGNTAFALTCVLDYARVVGDDDLASATAATTRRFYADDADYPVAYEPLGWDFLSPGLTEADLLRRVLDPGDFRAWLDGFLPDVRESPHDALLEPVGLADTEEGVALHLVGLDLSRAWCLADLAAALPDHRYADALRASAERHARTGLAEAFRDDYAGAHWLSSFAVYLLTRHEGGIAPGAPP
jgi:hypothetical protein